jgi:hypothetical protein
MSFQRPTKLTADDARQKAAECLEMADVAQYRAHEIMLQHIAETWERIARDIEKQN